MLGDSFPPDFMKEFSHQRGVSPGDVLYLECEFTTPKKMKYMVVVCCEPLLVLLINSVVNKFITSQQILSDCQIPILKKDHEFLDWDSFVNCVDSHSAFDLEVVKEQISIRYGEVLKGRITDECMKRVRVAVERSPTMVRRDKKKIIAALHQYQ